MLFSRHVWPFSNISKYFNLLDWYVETCTLGNDRMLLSVSDGISLTVTVWGLGWQDYRMVGLPS